MSEHGRTLLRVSAPIEPEAVHELEPARELRDWGPLGAAASPGRQQAGLVLAVIGSKGSPGASECAWSLAALADRRWPTLLVECDLLGGSLALRVAGDPSAGSLLGVANAAGSMSVSEIAELLPRWLCGRGRGWPATLLAPTREPSGEPVFAADALAVSLRALAQLFALVVVDLGWLLERECWVGRCHAAVLELSDAQLLVAGSRGDQLAAARIQLEQLLAGLALPATRLRIVLAAGAGEGSSDTEERERLEQDLARYGLAVDGVLPASTAAAARAARLGEPLALARHGRSYRRALEGLLQQLFVGSPPKRRLPRPRLALPARSSRNAAPVAPRQEEVVLPWSSR